MAINYTVGDNWGSGFVGNMTVPGGSQGLHGWTVEFDASFNITNIWSAEIVSHVGNHYVIRNAAWNADVGAGANASFGFQATTGANGTTATGFALNGTPDGTSAPPVVVPAISIDDASINEGNSGSSQINFTVKLSQATTVPVTVNYATGNGSATAGSDYTQKTGTVTFAAGEISKTISVAIAGDSTVEANETLTVTLSGPSGGTIADASANGTIVNDDVAAPPPPSGGTSLDYGVASNWGSGFTGAMTVGAGSAALNGWTVEFDASFNITNIWNAVLVSHVGNHYVVRNAAWNGSVAGGDDTSFGFNATPGSAGTTASTFMINGAAVGSDPVPVVPTLAVADATVAEGNSGTKDLAFTVTLSAASATPVTVAYATSNGTAIAGSDYTAASGTLTFAAGETSKLVHLNVAGDTAVESNETLTLTLSSPNGATIADATAIGTITNDDTAALPTLAAADATVVEGNSGTSDLAFTVSLSAAATAPITVAYGTSNGTATAGSDYTASTGILTFAAGETSKVVHVNVAGDTAAESNETLTLTLSSPSGATIADATAIGTITNDDTAAPPTLSIADATVTEGNPGAGGGAAAGYFSTSGNQIVDAAGNSVQIAGVNWFGFENSDVAPHGLWTRNYKSMMDQMVDLGFNTIRLPFSNDTLRSTATPNVNLGANPDLQGLTAMQLMDKIVDYAGEIGLRIILDHHRNDSGAGASANGLWYDGAHPETQWISDWQALAARYAGNPTVIGADLHNEPHAGTWGGGGANDWAAAAERAGNAIGQVNPNWLIFVEGVANYEGQPYWWGGNLMGVRDRPIDLAVDNKLVYSAHDYPNSVWPQPWFQGDNFAAGLPAKFDQMWGYIYKEGIAPVFIGEFGTNLSDPKDAPWLEAITSYLSGDLNNDGTSDIAAGTTGPSWTFWSWNPNSGDTGGILANDWNTVNQNKMAYLTPIQFDLGDLPEGGGEGPQASFLLTLSAPATGTITVNYHTEAGTAQAAGSADFVSRSGTVTFAAGEQSKTISIAITPDTLDEANETFTVVLTDANGAVLGRATGVATIVDDDVAGLPALAVANATVTEGNSGTSDLAFTVTLSAASTASVTVAYATSNGSATSGSDYTAASGTLTFAPGETSKVVHVAVTGDTAAESNETLTLVLSSPAGATIADGSGAGTITNDDTAPPPSGDLEAAFSLTDSWSSGFNGNVVVHNEGSAVSTWQIVIEMPNQITDIWNARILSHEGNTYVIGPTTWNANLGHDGETSFGFVASGAYNASSVQVHGLGQDDVPDSVPTVPTGLVASAISDSSTMLTWEASSVPGGGFVTGYAIFVDGEQVGTTTSTSFRVKQLSADTDYHFSVAAIDGAGMSAATSPITVHTAVDTPGGGDDGHMFSPYIDMAMNNAADLAGISETAGIDNFTLAFVLASNEGIGWQGWGSIDDDTLFNGTTILQHVQDIQAAGGNITISFGGAAGTEAALVAANAAQLQAQYQSVIDRYAITSIDFDIEGSALPNSAANAVRDQAIVGLQAANPDLKVSFTLPVLPTGLTQDGINILQGAMNHGVRVDMVNIMAMDYGQSVDNNGQMGLNAILASEATQQQLASIGLDAKIGITPMIGVNDIISEVFTLADAQSLVDYAAADPDVAMLSMWSVARDNGNSAGANYASSDSSGIAQNPYQFASIFSQYDNII